MQNIKFDEAIWNGMIGKCEKRWQVLKTKLINDVLDNDPHNKCLSFPMPSKVIKKLDKQTDERQDN